MSRILIIFLSLSMVGCSSKRIINTIREVDVPGSCRHLDDEGGSISFEYHNLAKAQNFYEQLPSSQFSGITSANINDAILTISLVNKEKYKQYSVPLFEKYQNTTYGSHPIRATMATIMYAGIPWLITDHFSDLAFGCTEQKKLNIQPDYTKKTSTGKFEYRDNGKPHKISISGFDKDYSFEITNLGFENRIDLIQPIFNTQITDITTLKITCLDCSFDDVSTQYLTDDIKKTIVMNHDFRPLKTYFSGKNDRNALLTKDTKIPTDSDFKKLTPNSKTGKLE